MTNPTDSTPNGSTRPDQSIVPGDLFARHQTITGLRALADFLEANPGVPVCEFGDTYSFHTRDQDEEHQRAEIARIADLLGATPDDDTPHGGHLTVHKTFGRITYKAVFIPTRRMQEHEALMSYSAAFHRPDDKTGGRAA